MNEEHKILGTCVAAARKSDCEKFWFGAVLVEASQSLRHVIGYNARLSPLLQVCGRECVRMSILSRTHSMLGSCAHAEEWALQKGREAGFDMSLCTMFIAGVNPKTNQILLSGQQYTCIRCAVQMYMHGISRIKWWTDEGWKMAPSRLAIQQAYEFAKGAIQTCTWRNEST